MRLLRIFDLASPQHSDGDGNGVPPPRARIRGSQRTLIVPVGAFATITDRLARAELHPQLHHSDIPITMGVYGHVFESPHEHMTDELDAFMAPLWCR